jgi:protein-tyrosine phosphatase
MTTPHEQPLPGHLRLPRGRVSMLFVCLGNICRSPLAALIVAERARAAGRAAQFEIDSAGTGDWHAGEGADPRSVQIAGVHGLDLRPHRARQVLAADFERFDLVLAMDKSNARNLVSLGAPRDRVRLMRAFDPAFEPDHAPDVPDPYYGGPEGFSQVFEMLDRSAHGLLAAIPPA